VIRIEVTPDEAGTRLDQFLAARLEYGRHSIARLLQRVSVNGRKTRKGDRLAAGDVITIAPPTASGSTTATPFVVRVTRDVLVVAKPSGLPSVSLAGDDRPTLAGWVADSFPECARVGAVGESGLAHRLDTQTSGLMLVARNPEAYRALRDQFRAGRVEKGYVALVWGELAGRRRIDAPIGQHRKSRRRVRALLPGASARRYASGTAETLVEPLLALRGMSLVRATTHTGKRHQVRVHLAAAGHPLVNDRLYGGASLEDEPTAETEVSGYWLHAATLRWASPATSTPQHDALPVPAAWQALLASLGAELPHEGRAHGGHDPAAQP
jgi:23S rRNA pseudouridine1911/1915/1917 synthase